MCRIEDCKDEYSKLVDVDFYLANGLVIRRYPISLCETHDKMLVIKKHG